MKKLMSGFCMLLSFVVIIMLTAGCGGGGGSDGGTGTTDDGGDTGTGGEGTTVPKFTGFDFTLATGNFWEYKWDYSYQHSSSQGTSTLSDTGRFWVVLGPSVTIQGVTAYEVKGYGKSIYANKDKSEYRSFGPAWKYDSQTTSYVPKWRYVAISNNKVLASADGITLKTLFDAQSGSFKGGGFFTAFPDSLIVAQNGTISSSNNYISGSAVVIGRSANQSLCEYIAGEYICTGSFSQDLYEYEYYRPSIGPVGYYYYNSAYFSNFPPESFNWKHNVGLVASSFTGQANPLVTGVQSINSVSSAKGITTANPAIGTVWSPALISSGTTKITVTVVDDNGTTHTNYQTYVENWYSFTLVSARTVSITLSFEGAPIATDLDMFLMNSNATALYGYSIHDNPAKLDQHEKISVSLAAGTYRIGIDHEAPAAQFPSNSPSVKYTLVFE